MTNAKVANRYAKGLLKFSEEKQTTESLFDQAKKVIALIKQSKDFRNFLKTPIIDSKTKILIISEIFKGFSKHFRRFCELLIRNKREQYLDMSLREFVRLRNLKKGIQTAFITTAKELSPREYDLIIGQLVDGLQGQIDLKTKIDPTIIGGFIIRVGDKQIDQSFSGKLKNLKKEFSDNLYIPKF